MTKPHDLDELAVKVEAASGPDRELDADIGDDQPPCRNLNPRDTRGRVLDHVPRYTASLDAAMTLIPEGALWEVDFKINIGTSETFERPKGEPEKVCRAGVGVGDVPAQWTYARSFATPAIALTAAALRARASLTRSLGGG